MRRFIFTLGVLALTCGIAPRASANPTKELVLTSAYGIVAGSIVGLASLAFFPEPGEHLRNIALGASIGLYAGTALGLYVAYGLPMDDGGTIQPLRDSDVPLEEPKSEEKKEEPLSFQIRPLVDVPTRTVAAVFHLSF